MSQPSIPPQTFPTSDEGFRLIRVSNPDSSLPFRVANGWFLILFQLSGKAEVQSPNHQLNLEGGSVYRGSDPSRVKWGSDSRTEAVAIHLSKAFLASQLEPYRPGLNPDVRASVFENRPDFKIADLTEHDQRWIQSLELPPVVGIASKFWFRAKLQELLALQTFPSGPPKQDFFCSQQRRIQSKRVESVKRILEASLDEPLSLKDLAREIGCSSAYLCRTFSAETGTTISRYLRSRRIEKAAELIQSGRFNVSEAAVEVGYQSLSHFSKAFFEEKGCLPSQFLNAAQEDNASPITGQSGSSWVSNLRHVSVMNYSNTDSRLPRTVTFTDSELDRILQKILEEKPKSSRQAKASKQSPARAAVADENWQ